MQNTALRNVVFVDYQNFYHGLKQHHGVKPFQINMLELLKDCVQKSGISNPEIRVYTGVPDADTDPVGHGYMRRFVSWLETNGAKVWTRPLKYQLDSDGKLRGSEKGADVRLSCELVALASSGKLGNAVIISADQDLNEAVKVSREATRENGLPDVAYHSVRLGEDARGIDFTTWITMGAEMVNAHKVHRTEELCKKRHREDSGR